MFWGKRLYYIGNRFYYIDIANRLYYIDYKY